MSLVVHRARLVTCDPDLGQGPLGVIEPGALVAERTKIVWVGPESELARLGPDAIEVDAGGRAVLPGLVDCHTHLLFAGDRSDEFAARMRGQPYRTGGIRTTVAATRAASDEQLKSLARSRLQRFLAHGVTTVEVKSGYGLDLEQELRLLRLMAELSDAVTVVPTLLGAHVLPDEYHDCPDAYVELVAEHMVPAARGLAEFCDAWCEHGAFTPVQCRRVLRAGLGCGLLPKLHAEQLSRGGGARLAAEVGAVSADHLEHVTPEDAHALAAAGTVAVLMPGASMLTGAPFAPARMLIEHGVRVALSTDCNPGTSFSENLPLQVALGCALLRLTPEEAIAAVTREAAAALRRGQRCGRLRPGLDCDAVVLETKNEVDLAYHYGVNLVATVIKGGEVR